MSFLSHNSSNHNHLSRRIGKHDGLHSVTSGKHHAEADPDPNHPRPFAPIKIDEDAPPPKTSFDNSIFKL